MVSPSRTLLAAATLLGLASGAPAATTPAAQSCHNPDALGTSRVVAVGGTPELGLKTYPQTLDLADHEVVLTFDDGPWAPTTPAVLDALKAQCVSATFFLIGRNAEAHPALVKREVAEGHSVGHHTYDHPAVTLHYVEDGAAVRDIERGMEADDKAAGYGPWTGAPHVPFFRFPGFGYSPATTAYLHAHGIATFGADLWASDWIPMTPEAEFDRLMGRLRAAGRGIILLHDIKRQTADMLPRFLAALKAEGFHVVHMVPGGTAAPTRPAPAGWESETERTLVHLWPKPRAAGLAAKLPAAAGPSSRPSQD
ncbi:polysaccharide deacetylase family protein [Lichenibacterium ramalinae]|uniref:Chitooligosaccharide deacetylase n=1 Tax=Lichenibacterium ramalinae TaxID=2316527 RepID=A0A4Q2R8Y7_9HYPH|nr:polysaccharide deacetylase family protein [Lichenibacterium ramalinae]RYB02221.1 polysaccharide deacetylase family protein [Lichenibacterium ramalinae]